MTHDKLNINGYEMQYLYIRVSIVIRNRQGNGVVSAIAMRRILIPSKDLTRSAILPDVRVEQEDVIWIGNNRKHADATREPLRRGDHGLEQV